jgi:biotin synthase-related radical SAM superfamily protein
VHALPEKNCHSQTGLPGQIRVSVGTAIVLGLFEGKLDAQPTTAYLMTHRMGKCTANCGFCPQARTSKSNDDLLSRVSWPAFPTLNLLTTLATKAKEGKILRVCIQALNYPEVFGHLVAFVKEIKRNSSVPVSVSCQPLCNQNIELLRKAGVDRLGIALDAATEAIFDKIKGARAGGVYSWEKQFRLLEEATAVFGKGNVSTHVIIGLGETEKESADVIQRCVDTGVLPALFAFTPVNGTALEAKQPPKLESYRRVQLARHLIVNVKARIEDMKFDVEGKIIGYGVTYEALEAVVDSGLPFRTSGCPSCNRPYYNEKPSGPLYNYPKQPNTEEIEKIKTQLRE